MADGLRDLFIKAATQDGGDDWGDVVVKRKQAEQKAALEEQQRQNALKSLLNLQKEQPGLAKRSMQMGEVGIGPERSGIDDLLDLERMRALKDQRLDAKVEKFGGRIEKAKLGEQEAALGRAQAAIPQQGAIPGQGGITGRLPNWLVKGAEDVLPESAAESMGLKGASEVRSAIEQSTMIARNLMFGATLTGGEKESARMALADMNSGNPQRVRNGLKAIADLSAKHAQVIESSTAPEARQRYVEQGGSLPSAAFKQASEHFGGGQERRAIKRQRNKRTGQTRIVYSDGTSEIVNE